MNVLLTSCADNICRIWCETIKQGEHQEPSSISVKSGKCHRHQEQSKTSDPFVRYQLESSLKFHIAAVVDPQNDIPLLSSLGSFSISTDSSSSFVLHWLNNKEIQFTVAAEVCLGAPILALEVQSVDVSEDSSISSKDSEYDLLVASDDNDLDQNEEGKVSCFALLLCTKVHYTSTLPYIVYYSTLDDTTPLFHTIPLYSTIDCTTPHRTTTHHNTSHHITIPHHITSCHVTPLHYTALHHTTLHYTTLHYTTLHCTALHYTTLHCTTCTLHYITLHYTSLQYSTVQYTTLHYTTLHVHYTTVH